MQTFLGFITPVHIGLGGAAVVAGAAAFAAPKGRAAHVGAGRVFVITLSCSAGLGAVLGLMKAESLYITFHAGILALTLILSGWLAARIRSGGPCFATFGIGLANLANTAGLIVAGSRAQAAPDGLLSGFPAEDFYFLAGMAGLAASADASLLFRRAVSAQHRVARHLWRMGLGFFIAAGSAFTGPGAEAFPEIMRQSGILALPELIIAALILFWLGYTLFRRGMPSGRGVS